MLFRMTTFWFSLLVSSALAQSTINPNIPPQSTPSNPSPLSSAPIRGNFSAAFRDINGIITGHPGASPPAQAYLFEDWLNTNAVPYVWHKYVNPAVGYATIGTIDPTTGTFVPGGGSFSFTQDGVGAVPITFERILRTTWVTPEMYATNNVTCAGGDDGPAIQRAVTYAGTIRTRVRTKPCAYKIVTPVVDTVGVELEGYDGELSATHATAGTMFVFAPSIPGQISYRVRNAGNIVLGGGISNVMFWSDDTATQKTALEVEDVSRYRISKVRVSGAHVGIGNTYFWSGAGSVGIRTRGREFIQLDDVDIAADWPLVLSDNPNSTIDLDWFDARKIYLRPNGNANILMEDGVNSTHMNFDGVSCTLGTHCFKNIDTTSAVISVGWTFRNFAIEQGEDPFAYNFLISHRTDVVGVEFSGFQSWDPGRNGALFRNIQGLTMGSVWYIGTGTPPLYQCLDVDSSVHGLSWTGSSFTACSTSLFTGQTLVRGESLNGFSLPRSATYASTLDDATSRTTSMLASTAATPPLQVSAALGTALTGAPVPYVGASTASVFAGLRFPSPGALGAHIDLGSSRGAAPGTHGAVQAGDGLGGIVLNGDNGATYTQRGATFGCVAVTNWNSSTSNDAKCVIATTPTGAINPVDAVTIQQSGGQSIGVGATDPGVGNLNLGGGKLQNNGTDPIGTGAYLRAIAPSVSDLTVTGSFTATGLVTNADLANSAISGVSLGGTLGTLTFGTHLASGGASYNGSSGVTITSDATAANTASTIMARDGSGQVAATTFTGALAGNASTASSVALGGITGLGIGIGTALGTNVGSAGAPVLFNGAGGTPTSLFLTNATGLPNAGLLNSTVSGVSLGGTLGTLTFGTHLASGGASYNGSSGITITSDATAANTASTIMARDGSGQVAATTFTGALAGNASTATTASDVANAPVIAKVLTGFASGAGTVSAADSILSALQKIDGNVALKAPLASPNLTGVPATTLAAVDTSTSQIASTAFVIGQAASATPLTDSGTGSVGTSTRYARGDHVHPLPAIGVMSSAAISVNFNSANTDFAVPIVLPPGYTRFLPWRVDVGAASGTLNTATFGMFSTTGGSGVTILSAQGTGITTASDATIGNATSISTIQTASFVAASLTPANTIQLRVVTPQGSTATATATLLYFIMP